MPNKTLPPGGLDYDDDDCDDNDKDSPEWKISMKTDAISVSLRQGKFAKLQKHSTGNA